MHHLSRQGYRVRTASDGKATLATLAKEETHVLLLDLQLPELDGFTVLRHVRDERRGPFPYVIAMSCLPSEEPHKGRFFSSPAIFMGFLYVWLLWSVMPAQAGIQALCPVSCGISGFPLSRE